MVYECEKCGKEFEDVTHLQAHMASINGCEKYLNKKIIFNILTITKLNQAFFILLCL